MNKAAEKHLAKARDYLAKGDDFYRKAKPEIDAAAAAGATVREMSRYLDRSKTWVGNVLTWDGLDTLYGKDTNRRQIDQAKQMLRDAPLEQVEQMFDSLTPSRKQAIAAAAGNAYAKARQDYDESERSLSSSERRERERAQERITRSTRQATADFALGIVGHLEQATDELRELVADASLTPSAARRIEGALDKFTTEFAFAKSLVGEETS